MRATRGGKVGRRITQRRVRLTPWLMAAMLSGLGQAAQGQPIVADVRQAGFPAVSMTGHVVRSGQWAPLVVSLRANGTEPIECYLETERLDIDGDRVRFVEGPIVVTPGVERLAWLYAATSSGDSTFKVSIVSADGAELSSAESPLFEWLSDSHELILDISQPQWTALQTLESKNAPGELGARKYNRSFMVGRMPFAHLPDRWWGLESVDVIVWDQPDPSAVSTAQLAALIDWVRCGGQLVIGLGDAWPRVRNSPLAAILPVSGDGPTRQVAGLKFFLRQFAADEIESFKRPISVADLKYEGAWRVMDRLSDAHAPFPLIVMGAVGSGRVTVVAASLRDLTEPPEVRTEKVLGQVLDYYALDPGFLQREADQAYLLTQYEKDLHSRLLRPIEFQQLGSLFLFIAICFVAAYAVASTVLSWWWLTRRKLTYASWSVFAGFAVAASLLSLGAVRLSRGWQDVQSVSLIDCEAGSSTARAGVYFGYRSSGRQRDDLSLSSEPNQPPAYVRGLSRGVIQTTEFKTPDRYTAHAKDGLLSNVLMRATLKEFEGHWSGALSGTIRGQLTASRRTGRILTDSYLVHDLPTTFQGGVLLYTDPRLNDQVGDVPLRAAVHEVPYRLLYRGANRVPPSVNVLAVGLPQLPPNQRIAKLGEAEYANLDQREARWESSVDPADARARPDPRARPEPDSLWDKQVRSWAPVAAASFLGLEAIEQDVAAALLLSTRNLYQHNAPNSDDFTAVGTPFGAHGLVDRDITHWLMRGQAVLLLWAREPAPAGLLRDGRPLRTYGGLTLYRVRVPIAYVDSPPPRTALGATPAEGARAGEGGG